MFCVIADINNKLHILDIKSKKKYFTFCNFISQKDNPNIFAANDVFDGICIKCVTNFKNEVLKYQENRDSSVNNLQDNLNPLILKYMHLHRKKYLNSNCQSIEKLKNILKDKNGK